MIWKTKKKKVIHWVKKMNLPRPKGRGIFFPHKIRYISRINMGVLCSEIKHWLQNKIKSYLPRWRTGNTLSRIVRAIFEKPQIRRILGLFLVLVMVMSGSLTPVFGNTVRAQTTQEIITPPDKVLTTQTTFQRPVGGVISQGFHWYHQAVDIANNGGEEVKPVANGEVIEIGYQFWGYGNFVIVDHGQGITSLYAHLSSIKVVKDQEVTKDTVLGVVGSTGRSTGPHLHLEIWENSDKLNPSSFIKDLSPEG